jgi:HAD superfamily hydrolase (TIGR01548 family)
MQPKLIVFDMDGVLIDVSRSYRETVRKTARLFFTGAKGFDQLPDPLFSLDDLTRLKQSGGLNNDWDLTSQVLSLLFARIGTPADAPSDGADSPRQVAIPGCDVRDLADYLRGVSFPLTDLLDRYGRRKDPRVTACDRGNVRSGNLIKRIFQEIYLGPALFSAIYRLKPLYWLGDGLIKAERPLMDRNVLQGLAREHILAVATGRPKAEADVPLDHFSLRGYFQLVVTLDDCTLAEERSFLESGERISLSKPHPFMLDWIARRMEGKFRGCFYVGDMPDDMLAARASRAGFQGIGIVLSLADLEKRRETLLQAGAGHIIENTASLLEFFALSR